ncbi:class I SAM-dependent methyltransferase [Lentzea sp. BCCO 10_0856]|uniref:Class I SAM-dependent methyltransferase n=1 Tax=Lentzea miocenica TaxID=3095431 RepID=A0ABU4TCM2_9PSEU|nr:class I SAM-dependent methyltransferase [Lentzea sp. BCCO 10_0856]MDX8035942.1 class I SAM-dependent methyltransferase [Lentzea sp. BCCO 10_0856]
MVDFEEFYRGGELVEGMPHAGVPWDIGAPQPVVVDWERAGRFRGHVLDAGCGTGDNAIFLASRGLRVTAVDIAPTAIETARARGIDSVSPPSGEIEGPTPIFSGRSDNSGSVEWVVGDSAAFAGRFDTVLASALIHCVPAEQRPGLAAALRNAAVDGALLNLTSLAVEGSPFDVTEPELRSALEGAGWEITRFERDVIVLTGVNDLPELPVWVVEATATSRGADAATTP